MTTLSTSVFARRLRESDKIPITFEHIGFKQPKYTMRFAVPFIMSCGILYKLYGRKTKVFRCKLASGVN